MTFTTTILACFLSMTPGYETLTQTQTLRSNRPVREARPVTLSGELGWNGLAGSGLLLSWSPHPHISIDGGVGYSVAGPKVGLRGRYNLLKSNATPFIGLGMGQAFGSFGEVDMRGYTIKVDDHLSAQATVGLSYVSADGFSLLAGVGYAMPLQDETYKIVKSSIDRSERDILNTLLGSGPVLSIALGYSFPS